MMGAGGAIADITSAEQRMSETIKQLMFNAPFTNIIANKYKLLDDSYRGTGGYEDGTFKPNNQITRAEVCVILNRLTKVIDERFDILNRVLEEKFKMVDGVKM